MTTELRYHVPFVGYTVANLHEESDRIYRRLFSAGEVERLNKLDHLGVMRFAWEGAHHSRWEYTILILSLIERCKAIPQVHLASPLQVGTNRVSSGYELLKAWALLLNTGHLMWTFAAERALMLETWANAGARDSYESSFKGRDRRAFAQAVIRGGNVYRFFQTLAFIRLPRLFGDWGAEASRTVLGMLDAYLSDTRRSEQLARLRRLYTNLRRLAYMSLDTRYTPSVATVDLNQALTSEETLARLALHDPSRETDELDGLHDYLNRETYLGGQVMKEMARREKHLRSLIRRSLRENDYETTVEELATGELQDRVVPSSVRTILRVSGDVAGVLANYWPGRGNARVEQAKLDRELPLRSEAIALYWRTAGGTDWVLQSHAGGEGAEALVKAFYAVWGRTTDAQARARAALESERWADAFSEPLASSLVLQSFPLFFLRPIRWEWGLAGSWGDAVLVPRRGARWILEREAKDGGVSHARAAELRMLARTLRGRPHGYVAVSLAPLVAYEEGQQLAELDGCFVESDAGLVRLTLVEAKRKRVGARTATERALSSRVGRLKPRPSVRVGPVRSEGMGGGLARSWVTLEIRS